MLGTCIAESSEPRPFCLQCSVTNTGREEVKWRRSRLIVGEEGDEMMCFRNEMRDEEQGDRMADGG